MPDQDRQKQLLEFELACLMILQYSAILSRAGRWATFDGQIYWLLAALTPVAVICWRRNR